MFKQPARSPLFGDMLALARHSWVHQLAEGLARSGYEDYRRTDAAVFRVLRAPTAVGDLGARLGVTRQAARKVVAGLEAREYAQLQADDRDGRRQNVVLTPAGQAYRQAVTDVIQELNRELTRRVPPEHLEIAKRVLQVVVDQDTKRPD